jgi:hypothetical protein
MTDITITGHDSDEPKKPTIQPGTMDAVVHALSALHSPTPAVHRWHDTNTASELGNKIADIADSLIKAGRYEQAANLKDAANALWDTDDALAEARQEIDDLRGLLASYRVVETFPATRETPAEYAVEKISDNDDE